MKIKSKDCAHVGGLCVHPIAGLFPLMAPGEFEEFAKDVAANGVLVPVTTWTDPDPNDGRTWLIDGRNRVKAAQKHGLKPPVKAWKGDDPTPWIISQNLHRRHLSESQRAMIGVRLGEHFEREAKARMVAGAERGKVQVGRKPASDSSRASDQTGHRARDDMAAMVNVSPTTIQQAKSVQKCGNRELIGAVDRGDVRVSAASTIAKLPPKDIDDLVAKGPKAIREASKIKADPVAHARAVIKRLVAALSPDDKALVALELIQVGNRLIADQGAAANGRLALVK